MRVSVKITAEASGPGIPKSWTEVELREALEVAVDLALDDIEASVLDQLEEPESPVSFRCWAGERPGPAGRISELCLPWPAHEALHDAGYYEIHELAEMSQQELVSIRGISPSVAVLVRVAIRDWQEGKR